MGNLALGLRMGTPIFTLVPLTFIWAATSRRPLEIPEGSLLKPVPLVMAAIFVPMALVGVLLCALAFHKGHPLSLPILGFVVLSALLLVLQFVLVRELTKTKRHLEDRVEERTLGLQQAQALLLRTERMNSLAMLGAGLAHDLNNSLCAAQGQLDLMQEDLKHLGVPLPGGAKRMEAALGQAAALTGRLMSFARQGAEPLLPLNLAAEAGRMEELVRMLLPRKVQLAFHWSARPLWVLASPGRVEQILVNLVGNARDALKDGGGIAITLEGSGDAACLRVSDTGCGIPKEHLERVFEPLFTTKGPGRGTGLGLSSVKALVEELGGSLALATTFTILLPLLGDGTGPAPDPTLRTAP